MASVRNINLTVDYLKIHDGTATTKSLLMKGNICDDVFFLHFITRAFIAELLVHNKCSSRRVKVIVNVIAKLGSAI